eukprot:scaffold273389_cov29-Tisochrysis_lutea.AAC.2
MVLAPWGETAAIPPDRTRPSMSFSLAAAAPSASAAITFSTDRRTERMAASLVSAASSAPEKAYVGRERETARVHTQRRETARLIGQVDPHQAVKSAWPRESRVQDVVPGRRAHVERVGWRAVGSRGRSVAACAPVRRADDDHVLTLATQAVHAREHLVERLLDLWMRGGRGSGGH